MRAFALRFVAPLALLFLASSAPGRAQEATKPAPTYAEALEAFAWNPARRGPLVAVVAPTPRRAAPRGFREVFLQPDAATLPPLADARRGGGYSPESVAARFDKASRRFGGLTALGPGVLVEYHDRLNRGPDLDADPRRWDSARRFLATLTKAQRRRIASKEGIGVGELTEAQRAHWERIVPNPFVHTRRNGQRKLENEPERRLDRP